MKGKDLAEAIGDVNDKYIEEASRMKKNDVTAKTVRIWKIVGIAACALLAVSVSIIIIIGAQSNSSSYSSAAKFEAYYEDFDYGAGVYTSYTADGTSAEVSEEEIAYETPNGTTRGTESQIKASEQKIIYTANIRLQSNEFEESSAKITELVSKYEAYIESTYVNNQSRGYRSGSFTIRVPAEQYAQLVEEITNVCTVSNLSQNAQDITESYHDIESRLETAKTKLKRLQELLAAAEDMSDIITIESAISDTEQEIDDYQRSLNRYDSQVSYSTVCVDLDEVYRETGASAPLSFGEKISKAFSDGLSGFGEGMGDIALWFAESWTWLLFVGAIIAAIVVVIIVLVKRGRKKGL